VLGIGYDIAPGDVAGWTQALQTLAAEPATAERCAARAAKLARDYFNLPRFEKDLTAYFQDLVENRPEPPPENVTDKLSPNAPALSSR
jgi:glycosyltransferase involved in cell wall biosynthesis